MTVPLEPLGPQDVPALRALLTRDPAQNLYLLGLLEEFGITPRAMAPEFRFFGQRVGSALGAALFVGGEGGLVVPSTSTELELRPLVQRLEGQIRATSILGERTAVETIARVLGPASPKVLREQRLFVVSADDLGPFTNPTLRLAREEDLSRLVPLAAAAVETAYGEKPLIRDPTGFQERVLRKIRARRTYVLELAGELIFKVDVGSRSEQGAELEGLYTHPSHRRRGHATLSLGQIARHLLSSLPRLGLRIDEGDLGLANVARKVGFLAGRAQKLLISG